MNNLQIIEVVTDVAHMQPLDLIKEAKKGKMSASPLTAGAPVTDAQMLIEINKLQTKYDATQTKLPTDIKANVDVQFNILAAKYKKNGAFLKGVANDAAVAAGDVNAGLAIVSGAGYKAKKVKASVAKGFKGDSPIAGQADITTKAVTHAFAYIRQWGYGADKLTPPTAAELATHTLLISPTTGVSKKGLTNGKFMWVREAYQLHVPKKKKGGSTLPTNATQRAATPATTSSVHTTVFSEGEAYYTFGNWIVITIK
ncbi:MAG TPA: hypothetical protein VF411_07945 [Bacteroidia bacterium]